MQAHANRKAVPVLVGTPDQELVIAEAKKQGVLQEVFAILACIQAKGIVKHDEWSWKEIAGSTNSDPIAALNVWNWISSEFELNTWYAEHDADALRGRGILLRNLVEAVGLYWGLLSTHGPVESSSAPDRDERVICSLMAGMKENVWVQDHENNYRRLSDKAEFALRATSSRCPAEKLVMALPLRVENRHGHTQLLLTWATPVTPEMIREMFEGETSVSLSGNGYDAQEDAVFTIRTEQIRGHVISTKRVLQPDQALAAQALGEALARETLPTGTGDQLHRIYDILENNERHETLMWRYRLSHPLGVPYARGTWLANTYTKLVRQLGVYCVRGISSAEQLAFPSFGVEEVAELLLGAEDRAEVCEQFEGFVDIHAVEAKTEELQAQLSRGEAIRNLVGAQTFVIRPNGEFREPSDVMRDPRIQLGWAFVRANELVLSYVDSVVRVLKRAHGGETAEQLATVRVLEETLKLPQGSFGLDPSLEDRNQRIRGSIEEMLRGDARLQSIGLPETFCMASLVSPNGWILSRDNSAIIRIAGNPGTWGRGGRPMKNVAERRTGDGTVSILAYQDGGSLRLAAYLSQK